MDDLLDADIGKHDYDWLLTPPETPLFPSSDASNRQLPSTAPRSRSSVRSVSTARASRLHSSQSENGHSTRPIRSTSVTRPSISNTYSSTSFSNYNYSSKTSVLSTSSASVTSRPSSTPVNRSTTRPSPSSPPVPARSPTPAKTRSTPTSPGVKTTKPSHNSCPSTPNSRLQITTNSNPNLNSSSAPRSNSQPSTPSSRPTKGRSPSDGRIPAALALRPSSPAPRTRAPVRPIDLPDFPIDVPPNLRTKLPERPASAGRVRPGAALAARANLNSDAAGVTACSIRKHSLPVVSRGRFLENLPKAKLQSNGPDAAPAEIQKSVVLEGGVRRTNKVGNATESTGFGRMISKKSLDMALRHMDIRQGMGGIRGASVFPQSIRSAAPKARPARMSVPVVPVMTDEIATDDGNCNETTSPVCNGAVSDNGDLADNKSPQQVSLAVRESELDLYGSSRYDAMLLREDSKNMNWLRGVEEKSEQSPVFDHWFEPLPEPFGLL